MVKKRMAVKTKDRDCVVVNVAKCELKCICKEEGTHSVFVISLRLTVPITSG